MAVTSRRTSTHFFMFESESQPVVAWIADFSSALWCFHNLFQECCHVFGLSINWSIKHINQIANDTLDDLARMGTGGLNFIEFL